ncbi:MAG: hypothetical protein EHM13_14160 [Acidobacteria bacterium]|nr:MAG: hypothetical protein EHM13_14160 [Acidobacteriota bacterium]
MRSIILALLACLAIAVPTASAEGYQERNSQVIRAVFGKYGEQSIRVSRSEAGLPVTPHTGR